MTTLTKQEAATLWGNGFKLQDKEGDKYSIVAVYDDKFKVSCDNPEMYNTPFDLKYDAIGDIAFIIARPLSQLTQEIEPGIVPIVEMAKIHLEWNEDGDSNLVLKYHYGRQINVVCTWNHVVYDEPLYNDSLFIHTNKPENNKSWINAYMDSLHFDRFNFKERGLTVDKSK